MDKVGGTRQSAQAGHGRILWWIGKIGTAAPICKNLTFQRAEIWKHDH